MKISISIILASVFLGACATPKTIVSPSTVAVKSNINQASSSVSAAKEASKRSSENIKNFKTDAEKIDFKSTKALELL